MSFTGNGGGRFQIRRIRNGSTAECFLTANGPFNQTFAEPTGFHTPNWNFVDHNTNTWAAGTTYGVGILVVFGTGDNEGIYRSRIAGNVGNTPTLNDTDDNWEYEGPEGDPLEITPQLIVNGVDLMLDGTRAASPVLAAITDVQWQVSTGATFVDIDPTLDGFSLVGTQLGGRGTTLQIDRNLDNAANFNTGALMGGQLNLRAVISYDITGVVDANNLNQTLMCNAGMVVSRTVLTESSMFSQIRLVDTTPANMPSNGSASQIWNSGFRADKRLRVDLFIGANNVAADPVGITGLTFQWSNSDGTIPGATNRDLDITRNDVNTAETYFCVVTDVETGETYQSNSLEIRDFLDPIQFQEIGTATVDTGSAAMLTVIPYQNGAPMIGLTAANTIYSFEYREQNASNDMTGQRNNDTAGRNGRFDTTVSIANRFPVTTGTSTGLNYVNDDNPVITGGIARAGHNTDIMGVTIMLTNGEVGTFGAFIDYDVSFMMVGN